MINEKIKLLLNLLNSKKLDLKKIKKEMDQISQIKSFENYSYLDCLLNPENIKGVRFPSLIPIPSLTFQLRSSLILRTSGKGGIYVKFNPFFLAENDIIGYSVTEKWAYGTEPDSFMGFRFYLSSPVSTFGYYNLFYYDGIDNLNGAYFIPGDVGQTVEKNIYNQYRLVSGSMKVKYIGSLNEAKGVLGGSIIFDKGKGFYSRNYQTSDMGAIPPYNFDPDYPYTNPSRVLIEDDEAKFSVCRDAFYNHEGPALEGLRMLYFPIDKSYYEFKKIVKKEDLKYSIYRPAGMPTDPTFYDKNYTETSGFNWVVYGENLPANSNCLRFDINLNFECLPDARFMNYVPLETRPYGMSNTEIEMSLNNIKNFAIQKL